MADAFPLRSPSLLYGEGPIYAYACDTCRSIGSSYERVSSHRWTDEEIAERAEHSRKSAEACCRCNRCGVASPDPQHEFWNCDTCAPVVLAEEEARRAAWNERADRYQGLREASLASAKDRHQALYLHSVIAEESEDEWCASWLMGCEFHFWARCLEHTDSDMAKIAELAGGWWYWPDEDENGERPGGALFYPREKWEPIYAEHIAALEANRTSTPTPPATLRDSAGRERNG